MVKTKSIIQTTILTLLTSCGTVDTGYKHEQEIFYKRDMELEINGQKFEGVGVLEDYKNLDIYAKFKDDGDMVWVETCHRNIPIEKAWKLKKGWIVKKNSMRIKEDLSAPIETKRYCP